VWAKALAYGLQAGEKAMTRSAHREAMGYLEQALSALPDLPEPRDTREQAVDLRRALALAAAGGDVVLRANQYHGEAYEAQGNYRRAIDYTVASLDRTRRYQGFD
jgi:tetratricopeptide (TPR) repeat protein